MEPKESPSPSAKSTTGGTNTTTRADADVTATPSSRPVADNSTTISTTTATSPSSPSSPTDADDTPAIEEGTSNPSDGADVATASPPKKTRADKTTMETTTQAAAGSPSAPSNADDKDTAAASTSPTNNARTRLQKKKSVPSSSPKENSKKKKKTNSAPPKHDPKTKTKYFAVRKCESLESPAIFSNLKDCNFYVNMDNDETTADKNEHYKTGKTRVEYQSFGSLDEAIGYAFPQEEQRQPPVQKKNSKNALLPNSRLARLQKEIDKLKEALKQEKDKVASNLENVTAKARDCIQKEVKRERNAQLKVIEQLKTRHEKALVREQKRSLKAIEKQAKTLANYKQRQAKKKRSLLELEGEQANGNETDASNTPLKRPRVEKTKYNRDNRQHLKWKMRFEQLVAYKEQYGDCNVPKSGQRGNAKGDNNSNIINHPQTPELKALGTWAAMQRTLYRNLQQGLPTAITRERIELLENLGFVWSLKAKVVPFEKRVEQLKEYRDEHGHCNVPQKTGPLGEWVMNMRQRYREQRLSAENIAILEEMGFQWRLHKPKGGIGVTDEESGGGEC